MGGACRRWCHGALEEGVRRGFGDGTFSVRFGKGGKPLGGLRRILKVEERGI